MPEKLVWQHTIALLLGGASRRMGRPKQDMVGPDGRTMLQMALDTARGIGRRVIVSGPAGLVEGVGHVADEREDCGPLAGIEAVLNSGIDDCYLFMPCDMPGLTVDILHRLVEGIGTSQAAVFIHPDGKSRAMLPLVLRTSTLAHLQGNIESGNRSVHGFLEAIHVAGIELGPDEGDVLVNINNQSDWQNYSEATIRP